MWRNGWEAKCSVENGEKYEATRKQNKRVGCGAGRERLSGLHSRPEDWTALELYGCSWKQERGGGEENISNRKPHRTPTYPKKPNVAPRLPHIRPYLPCTSEVVRDNDDRLPIHSIQISTFHPPGHSNSSDRSAAPYKRSRTGII